MPQSLSNIVLHIVFSTKDRQDTIHADTFRCLYDYLAGICRNMGCSAIRIGGTSNHVHVACRMSRTVSVAKLVEEMKKSSSGWYKTVDGGCSDFAWQAGYGAFSIGPSAIDRLTEYIDKQAEHHETHTYQQEYLTILSHYGVEHDERYVWD